MVSLCICGHHDHDHIDTTGRCDVSYCDCDKFDEVHSNNDDNPWGDGKEAE